MIAQKIVPPSEIEAELLKIWESLSKENTNKAGLFTLIVFSEKNKRLGYVRDTVQNIIEKFPCRIIFITYEPKAKENYLKTAVSVLFPSQIQKEVACDSIDIGVGGSDVEKVKYVVLPLLLPDLPTHLFWCEDPHNNPDLLYHLTELASKVIFDSETADNIFDFSKFIMQNFAYKKKGIVDLNWLKTDDMRDIIASEFYSHDKFTTLTSAAAIIFIVNKKENTHIRHFLIQTYYVIFWLATRLGWLFKEKKIEKNVESFFFEFSNSAIRITINVATNEMFSTGDILKIHINAKDENEITFERSYELFDNFKVESLNPRQCDLPHNFSFKKFELGHFLAKEMISHKVSDHFIQTLAKLSDVKNG